jgi:hypothetical protein
VAAVAPQATPVVGVIGAMININDFSNRRRARSRRRAARDRPHRFRFVPTPHLPHGWDCGVMFEENRPVLLCSDLLHQIGDLEPVTTLRHHRALPQRGGELSAVARADGLRAVYRRTPRVNWRSWRRCSRGTLAAMHGSTFVGDGASVLLACDDILRETSHRRWRARLTVRRARDSVRVDAGGNRANDGELARAIARELPRRGESEIYRRFAPRVRLYGCDTCATKMRHATWRSRCCS